MFYFILLGVLLFTSSPLSKQELAKEATLKLESKTLFRQWATTNLCPRQKYKIEDQRLIDMNHDGRLDALIITKQQDHLCMLCATSMSQAEVLCSYCENPSLSKTITGKKHQAFHDTVQVGDPDVYSYTMYLFFQQLNNSFVYCKCDAIYLGMEYYEKSLLLNKELGFISYFFDYPINTRDKYVYRWNNKTKQLENF
jgi:hypothetical protein